MPETPIRSTRARFEQDSGDLQGLVLLKMLGKGYDFPPISVVVPMRPYNSFNEFYHFIGRGIRVILHPALTGRHGPGEQFLDVVCYAELGLDEHIETIYRENDMDPASEHHPDPDAAVDDLAEIGGPSGMNGAEAAMRPDAFVLFERGTFEQRVLHDEERVELRRTEREREALAQRYAAYAQRNLAPVSFEQFVQVMRQLHL
jgi:superfamily II DNA or RNA helicase